MLNREALAADPLLQVTGVATLLAEERFPDGAFRYGGDLPDGYEAIDYHIHPPSGARGDRDLRNWLVFDPEKVEVRVYAFKADSAIWPVATNLELSGFTVTSGFFPTYNGHFPNRLIAFRTKPQTQANPTQANR